MTYIKTSEWFSILETVNDRATLERMRTAAASVGGVSVEAFSRETEDDKEVAVEAMIQHTKVLKAHFETPMDPEKVADRTRDVLASGGYVVRLIADQSSGSGRPDLSGFNDALEALNESAGVRY